MRDVGYVFGEDSTIAKIAKIPMASRFAFVLVAAV
jgi:hypothetical protein